MMPSDSTSARTWSGSLPIRSNLRRNTAMCSQPNGISQFLGQYKWDSWSGDIAKHRVGPVGVRGRRGVCADVDRLCVAVELAVDCCLVMAGHRACYAVAHPGRVTAWNLFCT